MSETKTFQLKDRQTSFYDPETQLEVTRDQKVEIGPSVGKLTGQMIAKGGLVEVDGAAEPPTGFDPNAGAGSPADDELPEDFPGFKPLSEAGITKRSQLKGMTDDDLQATKNIGPKTAADIRAALK
jgi:hypothetical protein